MIKTRVETDNNNEKAKSALDILSNEQVKTIKDSLNKGGKNGKY